MELRGESSSVSLLMTVLSWQQLYRSGAESSAIGYQRTSSEFGLKVSLPKTKQMVTGRMVEEGDQECVALDGGGVEAVESSHTLVH